MYDHMYQRGYVENVPGAPMCGCVEQMPTVTRSDCTQVDLAESIKITFNSRSNTFTGKLTDVHVDFNACRGINNRNNDLWAYMARLYYQGDIEPSQFGEAGRIITNTDFCLDSVRYGLNEKSLHIGYDADTSRWTQVAGRDDLYDGTPFGYTTFMKSFFELSLTAPSQESLSDVNATFPVGETPIMMRVCVTCKKTHQYVFYRRLTPVKKPNINLLAQIIYHTGNAGGENVWKETFTLHSTYDDAVSGDNPWKCPGDKFNYNAPFVGDCSPDGTRVTNQHSRFSNSYRKDVAYYVNKPQDLGIATLDLDTSLRFSPALHTDVDMGNGHKGRTFEADDGSLHILGSGSQAWGHYDEGHYFSEPYSGDIVAKVHITALTGEYLHDWAKTGIMLRTDNSLDATNAFVFLSGRKGAWLQTRRSKKGSTDTRVPVYDYTPRSHAWLKIVKTANKVEAYISYDGGDSPTWSFHGSDVVNFPEDEYRVGLFVSSARNDWPAEATFEDYSVDPYSVPTVSPTVSSAPTSWEPLKDYNVKKRAGEFTANVNGQGWDKIMGSGTGLNGATDSFTFYNQLVSDDTMTVELDILKLGSWDANSRAGIMLRDTLDDDSAYAFVGVAGSRQGVVLQSRAAAGERTTHHKMIFTSNNNDNKALVKLQYTKSGSAGEPGRVMAYFKVSAGDDWRLLGQTEFKATGPRVLLGRAVTAGSDYEYALVEMKAKPLVVN
jgi:hypothetical protein